MSLATSQLETARAFIAALRPRPRNLTVDSRELDTGDAFLAYPGAFTDGRRYIGRALSQGASAVLWEAEDFAWQPGWEVSNLAVRDLRRHAGDIAHGFYGAPSEHLAVIGVTGTNGKTTTATWIAQAFAALGRPCGLIGTLGAGWPGGLEPIANTTPEAVSVHRWLRRFADGEAFAVAMEVSSHALVLHRVSGVVFRVAVFTNLSRDHLDFHADMESYAAAKARLFDSAGLGHAVLNLDDPVGRRLANHCTGRMAVVGYQLGGEPAPVPVTTSLHASEPVWHAGRACFTLSCGMQARELALPLLGRYNVANALAVAGALIAAGVEFESACEALTHLSAVAGRMQRFGGDGRALIAIDYAHTPDALDKALRALRPLVAPGGRLICVFGCGGERDPGKRPQMGAVAAAAADFSWVTSDNPRAEEPLAIIAAITSAMPTGTHAVEVDRRRAIGAALHHADRRDVVLIAGKGHETTQEIAGRKLPFSDAAVVSELLLPSSATARATDV